ncbi:hypothetical protein U27_04135 [Candidatus Vecturithrix granuli]|uniref:Uncharacterized protein n=1 Tax=Vecturithrix granuli TaxID=1499967 RepID=A0A081BXW5_VECG1|nr:hypothetical protein U27_04135 [Candidatus Vecturithrix granuli]
MDGVEVVIFDLFGTLTMSVLLTTSYTQRR